MSLVPLTGCTIIRPPRNEPDSGDPPRYILSREADELYLHLEAVGYKEIGWFGTKYLKKLEDAIVPRLIFTLPPQHYAETALTNCDDVTRACGPIPDTLSEDQLNTIKLTPSGDSQLVFSVDPETLLKLDLDTLLNWDKFNLVLPDLNATADPYELSVPSDQASFTRIEMPWGIELSPITDDQSSINTETSFGWRNPVNIDATDDWSVIWYAQYGKSIPNNESINFEIHSVSGFKKQGEPTGSVDDGTLVANHTDANLPASYPEFGDQVIALSNIDRAELAASLSRRFEYTGIGGNPPIETGSIHYKSEKFNPDQINIKSCFEPYRSIPVDTFILSPRGGSLKLDAKWIPSLGCSLSGWTHNVTLGRNQKVKTVHVGHLYPFGIAAELVILTERVFSKDIDGHYIGYLAKQAFIEVPQPNKLIIEHSESVFREISITTKRTPPLDLPPSGNPGDYSQFDYFMPKAEGVEIAFRHEGIDWNDKVHATEIAMFFVSGNTRSANGQIWEPDIGWDHTGATPGGVPIENSIPRSGPDGLRVVDKKWNQLPHRFAKYNNELITISSSHNDGATDVRVNWVEWTRGITPALNSNDVAVRPFLPRTRTFKIKLQGIADFSGQDSYILATFRDTRFARFPILDPEPTTPEEVYYANVAKNIGEQQDVSRDFAYILETRELIGETGAPAHENDSQQQKRIQEIYYRTSAGSNLISDSLFSGITNEIQFGTSNTSQSTGGIAVPDTHVSTLTEINGPSGDATFNPRKWAGYSTDTKNKFEISNRLDYATYSRTERTEIDQQPFDKTTNEIDLKNLVKSAHQMMGFGDPTDVPPLIAMESAPDMGLMVADLFGVDAQIIPGLSLSDLFETILLVKDDYQAEVASLRGEKSAKPLNWDFKITGIDWFFDIIGNGPGQIPIAQIPQAILHTGQNAKNSLPVELGMEASLNWETTSFNKVKVGSAIKFIPDNSTKFTIQAMARMSQGIENFSLDGRSIKLDLSKPEISSFATLQSFTVTVFEMIDVSFDDVSFTLAADGSKDFSTNIGDIGFKGPLEFINQLSKLLGSMGSDYGVNIAVTMRSIRISQDIAFPAKVGQPLFIGPAQMINLVISWGVYIPLVGRDVMAIHFAVSSREQPLTIYIPPWYGGKAHVLIELTTKGIRLLEISMEYGALIPITWGIAEGQASLTAGIFYMVKKTEDSGTVQFRAFVKAAAHLTVAGFIKFAGIVYIGMHYIQSTKSIKGVAYQRVSAKIGFVRFSYSFTAEEEEDRNQSLVADASIVDDANDQNDTVSRSLYGTTFSPEKMEAFDRFLDGYR